MANTTEELVREKFSLTQYWTLEIKRRLTSGAYEADWFDITEFLLDKGQATVAKQLDVKQFGWGNFSSSTASFKVNNQSGKFFPGYAATSLFAGFESRQYTRVRYKSGYLDVDGTEVDEKVFEGLLNEKTVKANIEGQTATFTATAYEAILSDRKTTKLQFSGTGTATDVISSLLSDTFVSQFITYNASKINPFVDTTFDDLTAFNEKTLKNVLDRVAEKTNSAWYLDISNELVLKGRAKTASTVFPFIGGNTQSKNANIISFGNYDEGYSFIINNVSYDTGTSVFNYSAEQPNLDEFGTFPKSLSGAELVTFTKIETIADSIIQQNKDPRRRIKLKTLYMPNVFDLFDPVSVTWYDAPTNEDTFVWNVSKWNTGKNYLLLDQGFFIDNPTQWLVLGWSYNTGDPYMDIDLIESV